MAHSFEWLTPAPLWGLALDDGGAAPTRFKRPALLRFAGDGFLPELQALLKADPPALDGLVARPETWRSEGAGWLVGGESGAVKLFQPAHNRYYLLAANLVCRRSGLPDRTVDAATEKACFVVRRLTPRTGSAAVDPDDAKSYDEMAWVGDRQGGTWVVLADPETLAAGEERLPLFPLSFRQEGGRRRLWAGLLPVAGREAYETGARDGVAQPAATELAGDPLADPRQARLLATVVSSLEQLEEFPDLPAGAGAELDAQAQESLAYTLLDLADFLTAELPVVWLAVESGSDAGLGGTTQDLFDHLDQTPPGGLASYREMLVAVDAEANRARLESGEVDADLTAGLLGLAGRAAVRAAATGLRGGDDLAELVAGALGDPRLAAAADGVLTDLAALAALPAGTDDAAARAALADWLIATADLVARELPAVSSALAAGSAAGLGAGEGALYALLGVAALGSLTWRELVVRADAQRAGLAAGEAAAEVALYGSAFTRQQVAAAAAGLWAAGLEDALAAAFADTPLTAPAGDGGGEEAGETLYLARCVYLRPACDAAAAPVVSRPSRVFSLASFFDPDAPIRALKIRMPASSIQDLRKFPKGVSILLSKQLRQQMQRAQQVGLDGLLGGDGGSSPSLDLGMICSFSIPIITICALILLMIIVQLLNIVFWWLPFFHICLPLPGGAKK